MKEPRRHEDTWLSAYVPPKGRSHRVGLGGNYRVPGDFGSDLYDLELLITIS